MVFGEFFFWGDEHPKFREPARRLTQNLQCASACLGCFPSHLARPGEAEIHGGSKTGSPGTETTLREGQEPT